MKPEAREALDAYFAAGHSWAQDREAALRSSRRVAWWVAMAACVVAICEALALVFLTPLKTVEPFTLLVDRQTGFVQTLKPLDTQLIAGDRALTQSFLVQYVIAREGFDINSLQDDYRKVGLWSAGMARTRYVADMQASNPDSPLARLPRSSVVDVRVKSVTPLANNVAMIRVDTARRDVGGQPQPARAWVSVIRYAYTGEPMSVADRMINPLGFRVSSYRRSAETLSAPESTTSATQENAALVAPGQTTAPNPPIPGRPASTLPPQGLQ